MTNGTKGLQRRWYDFYRSLEGNGGHSGGNRIYKDLGHVDDWHKNIYVAAMSVDANVANPTENDYRKMGEVAYLEYEAFAQYYLEIGGHPKYNKR